MLFRLSTDIDDDQLEDDIIKAIESKLFSDVVVSTDNQEIAKISKKHGANVPFIRPSNLADDTSKELLSWKHAVQNYTNNIDCFVQK